MNIGFDFLRTAAKPKRDSGDAPTQESMRANIKPAQQKAPSADQKKFRRAQTRQMSKHADSIPLMPSPGHMDGWLVETPDGPGTVSSSQPNPEGGYTYIVELDSGGTEVYHHNPSLASTSMTTKENSMFVTAENCAFHTSRPATYESTEGGGSKKICDWCAADSPSATTKKIAVSSEADLLRAMAKATLPEQRRLAAELQALRASRTAAMQDSLDVDLADTVIRDTLTPVRAHERTTASTDWITEVATSGQDYDHAMRTEATLWFRRLHAAVKADSEEFTEQARGQARRHAGKYGEDAVEAGEVFLVTAARLRRMAGDSIDPSAQSGNAESTVTEYDTNAEQEPLFADDWEYEADPEGVHPPMPGAGEAVNSIPSPGFDPEALASSEGSRRRATWGPNYECVYCGRDIVEDPIDGWVDPEADGDDSIWRETCDSHDTFDARHEPKTSSRRTAGMKDCSECGGPKADSDGVVSADPGCETCSGTGFEHTPDGRYSPVPGDPFRWLPNPTSSRRTAEDAQTCSVCGDKIAKDPSGEDNSTWHHDNGETHDHEAKPGGSKESRRMAKWTPGDPLVCNNTDCDAKASSGKPSDPCPACDGLGRLIWGSPISERNSSRRKTSISLTNVGIEGDKGVGTDPSGSRVKFNLSPKELADLKSVLYSDMAINFSGVDVDQADIVTVARRTTVADVPESFKENWDKGDGDGDGDEGEGKPWLNDDGTKKDSSRRTAAETSHCLECGGEVYWNGSRWLHSETDKDHNVMVPSKDQKSSSRRTADGGDDYAAAKAKGKARAKAGLPSELGQDNQEAYADGYSEGMREANGKTNTSRRTARAIHEIADDISREWRDVNYAAKPYLDAMRYVAGPEDMFGDDKAKYIVAYFLSNAAAFRGGNAAALKKELKDLMAGKTSSRTASTNDLHCDSCGFMASEADGHMGGENCSQCGEGGNGGHLVRDDKSASKKTSKMIGVRDEYDDKGTLTLWSGSFLSDPEGEASPLPDGSGYKVTPEYGESFEVKCPTPRTDANFEQVDKAIEDGYNQSKTSARRQARTDLVSGDHVLYKGEEVEVDEVMDTASGPNVSIRFLNSNDSALVWSVDLTKVGSREPSRIRNVFAQSGRTADSSPGAQNGNADSSLEQVEVGDPGDMPMWPVELTDGDPETAQDAADVASVPTPGGEAGYPQPTASKKAAQSNACLNGNHSTCTGSSCSCSCHKISSYDYSGACADGDHADCEMTHARTKGGSDCACPDKSHQPTASRTADFRARVQAGLPRAEAAVRPFGRRAALDGFWDNISAQLADVSANGKTADDVIRILNDYSEPSSGDAFFGGSGGDDSLWGAVTSAGWRIIWSEADYYWVAQAPNGDEITYVEGDVYKGDTHTASKTAMPNPVDLGVKVGDIFYSNWGYDQTNIDYYEVTGLTGASVKVRQVNKTVVSGTGGPHEEVVPLKGHFFGDEMTKRIQSYGDKPGFNLNSYAGAYLWDGTPKYQTGYGYGH